jgi:hypothetical protein
MIAIMRSHQPPFRAVAVVLVIVLAALLATPARAEAEVLTVLALVGAGLAVLLIVGYLIVANVEGSRRAGDPSPPLLAGLAEPGGWAPVALPVGLDAVSVEAVQAQ